MHKLVFIVSMAVVPYTYSASVEWDCVSLYKFAGTSNEYSMRWSKTVSLTSSFDLQVDMFLSVQDGRFLIATADYNDSATGVVDNWLLAGNGDVADASTTRNQSTYFNHCHLDHQAEWRNAPVSGELGTDFYLMFAVGDLNDYNNNIPNPDCLYGWTHLSVDANGDMHLLGSAIGLDGQSMVVGGIPEPSSALLLLLGVAGLALRRKRT